MLYAIKVHDSNNERHERKQTAFVKKAHDSNDERHDSKETGVVCHKISTSQMLESGRHVSKKPASAMTNVSKVSTATMNFMEVRKKGGVRHKSSRESRQTSKKKGNECRTS